jgi:[ribosomal protein S5]-alanine N-acetyltransferase
MSLLDFLRPGPPVLSGEKVILRGPRMRDHREWAQLRRQSREFLEPWEPSWGPDELGRSSWRQRIHSYRREYARGTGAAFLIIERGQGRIVGGISMGIGYVFIRRIVDIKV